MNDHYVLTKHQLPRQRPKPPVQPLLRAMDNTNEDIRSLLSRNDLPMEQRMKLYQQSLRRYLNFYDQYEHRTPSVKPVTTIHKEEDMGNREKKNLEQLIIDSAPKQMQNKAKLLVEHFRDNPYLQWDDKGQIIIDGKTVDGSNIVDLVGDAMRSQKRKNYQPVGMTSFVQGVKQANIPSDWIRNESYVKQMRKEQEESDVSQIDDSIVEEIRTPSKKKVGKKKKKLMQNWLSY